MKAHRTSVVVPADRSVTLRDLPFEEGRELDIIVIERSSETREGVGSEGQSKGGTAGALRNSSLVGLWEDRDLPDSPEYARQLREEAQNRPHLKDLDLSDLKGDDPS